MTKMKHLSDDARRRLDEAMALVAKRTSAHFALVITPISDRYQLFPLLWAAAIAFVTGGGMAIVWPHLPLSTGFLIEAATLAVLALIFDWLPLRLLLVPGHVKREHCADLARREFAARILADHEHRPGMLFFVSLGEHHVEILADNAVHTRIGQEAWNGIVADFVTSLQKNPLTVEGLLKSIDTCGALLARYFPRPAGKD